MTDRPAATLEEDAADELAAALGGGLAGESRAALCARLGVPEDGDDRALARALVHALAAGATAPRADGGPTGSRSSAGRVAAAMRATERIRAHAAAVLPADGSLLGRLIVGAVGDGQKVEALDDTRTLVSLLRGGSLAQRRAAVRRLAEVLAAGAKGQRAEHVKAANAALVEARDLEIAYELALARASVGIASREARAEQEALEELVARVVERVRACWSGELLEDPLDGLTAEERAQLILRVRELPDTVVGHLAAALEGVDGLLDVTARRALVVGLRDAGDPRLVAPLGALLDDAGSPFAMEAARALARIDDPRVRPRLHAAWERSVVAAERLVLAGALGYAGDAAGRSEARAALATADDALLPVALEALESLGTADDVAPVAALTTHPSSRVVSAVVRALARFGDARALGPLRALGERPAASTTRALEAEVDAAVAAIRARMDLRGEEPPRDDEATRARVAASRAAAASRRDPASVQMRAQWDVVVGHLWLFFGARGRAVARFEAAAARRAGWPTPLLAMGVTYEQRGEHAQALAAFRRAVERDRTWVEHSPIASRALARCFLRRADELGREGRHDVARGLVEEVVALDLRWADPAVRFEIVRRHDAFLLEEGRT